MKKILLSLIVIFLLTKSVLLISGCANIIPPQGGPRDSLPPVLLKVTPADSSTNFSANRITFTFDEYVDVQNVSENVLVSPLPKKDIDVAYKLNSVTVRLQDTLEANTTYSINFGNAIKDNNEGNPYKNFTYTFSTGSYLDSLELSGKVLLAENGKTDTTLIVMLHTSPDDSAVIKEKPRYVAKLDSKGHFLFKSLPPKTFYLYALKDEGGTKRYFSEKQLFAFADSAINVGTQTDSVILYAYATTPPAVQTATINLPSPGRNRGLAPNADRRLKYQTNLSNQQQDLFTNLIISFEQPLKVFDSSKISLHTDSSFNNVSGYSFKKDSTGKKIELITDWKENTLYHIIFDKDFAEDSVGKKLLKTDTLSFTTKKLTDYGSIQIKFKGLAVSKNPVLQIVQNESIVRSFPLGSETFSLENFIPGEYSLRILYDNNKNGIWDPGNFFGKHLQPEIVVPLERKLTIRAGWKNEFEIQL